MNLLNYIFNYKTIMNTLSYICFVVFSFLILFISYNGINLQLKIENETLLLNIILFFSFFVIPLLLIGNEQTLISKIKLYFKLIFSSFIHMLILIPSIVFSLLLLVLLVIKMIL